MVGDIIADSRATSSGIRIQHLAVVQNDADSDYPDGIARQSSKEASGAIVRFPIALRGKLTWSATRELR